MPRRLRLDAELVRREMARSREQAAELIAAGRVLVAGTVATKAATGVTTDMALVVAGSGDDRPDYVSRGAHKLVGALEAFTPLGLRVAGRQALDAGASTGGFTDVLLRHGVAAVVAVDVGYGQLAWSLATDDRVHVLDRTNIKGLTPALLPFAPDLVVGDLSFISLTKVLPTLVALASAPADFVLMVKPQFEVGRERVGKGGVVRAADLRVGAVLSVAAAARDLGLGVAGLAASPLPGPAGNVEYFCWFRADASEIDPDAVANVVAVGPQ
ncbi:MAG: TlyA family RNA methyltransferase [Nocardioidaceae bacterium]|nr:TlyA family RNA methyltransferase [Nocardioidaceae bacterium]